MTDDELRLLATHRTPIVRTLARRTRRYLLLQSLARKGFFDMFWYIPTGLKGASLDEALEAELVRRDALALKKVTMASAE